MAPTLRTSSGLLVEIFTDILHVEAVKIEALSGHQDVTDTAYPSKGRDRQVEFRQDLLPNSLIPPPDQGCKNGSHLGKNISPGKLQRQKDQERHWKP